MDDIISLLKRVGLPFAYTHFAEGEAPGTPYICFMESASDNFSADGRAYAKISEFHIELYTDVKDPTTEQKLEAELDALSIFYNKQETYIESENLYQVLYIFERKV